jgi:uncharacterized membrane protein
MRSRSFGLVIAALAVAMSIWAYQQLPPTVATHWSLNSTPDGFSSRAWALAIVPIILVIMTVMFNVLPKVDPRRVNYAKFLSRYWLIANVERYGVAQDAPDRRGADGDWRIHPGH